MHATDGRTSRAGGVVARVQRAVAAGQHRRVWREPARRNGRMARRIEAENEAAFGAPLGPGAGRWGWYPPPAPHPADSRRTNSQAVLPDHGEPLAPRGDAGARRSAGAVRADAGDRQPRTRGAGPAAAGHPPGRERARAAAEPGHRSRHPGEPPGALQYALRYPRRLSHLLLVGTTAAWDYIDEIMVQLQRRDPSAEVLAAFLDVPGGDAGTSRSSRRPKRSGTRCATGSAVMKLISVSVGRPRQVTWRGKSVKTSIWKTPVEGAVRVTTLNLQGDERSDLSVHGGADKAVYVYPSEHYAYWRAELPGADLPWGAFG